MTGLVAGSIIGFNIQRKFEDVNNEKGSGLRRLNKEKGAK
jgi:hypothetical protein